MPGVWRSRLDRLILWGNTQPILTIRRVIWVIPLGALLASAYVLAAVGMLLSLVFAPFVMPALRCAVLALDGGITLEPFSPSPAFALEAPVWGNPLHPYCIAGNVAWLLFFGWGLALAHLAAALVQAVTIIGLPTALTQLQLAAFVLWPFGRSLRARQLPHTLDDVLVQLRGGGSEDSSSPQGGGWEP